MSETASETSEEISASADASPAATGSPSRRSKVGRAAIAIVAGLAFLCGLAGMIAAAAFSGAQAGQRDAQLRSTATVAASLKDRFEKGNALLREGNYALAQANFEYILQYQPDNYGIRDLVATAIVAQTPTPTSTPTPVVTDKDELLGLLKSAVEAREWDKAIALAGQLIALDSTYESDVVADLRYGALVERGLERLQTDDVEQGLYDLDQAAAIRPLGDRVEGERRLAAAYQNALYFFGADWERSISLLEELYNSAPGYRNVGRKLVEAYERAGDAYSGAGNWCPAAKKYAAAAAFSPSASMDQKQRDAEARCLTATPVGLTGTTGVSTTIFNTAGISGRLLYNQFDPATNQYRYFLYDGPSATAYQTGSGAQPSYRPSTSPDGTRVTYSLFADGAARVVVAPADGSGAPAVVATGTYPAWGSDGTIAFQGCTDVCGIHLVNPDNPADVRRLTTSSNDINLRWSPSGDRIIYTSSSSGPWEIFTVTPSGQFQQLTGFGAIAGAPAFSPDASRIAFISNRDGNWGVYIMNADGSNPIKLIDLGPQHPAWQSDQLIWTQ